MRGAYHARQSCPLVNVERSHQVEPEQREVCQIVLRQFFAAQVSMHTAQPAKAIRADARSLQVRQFNAARIADDDVFDITLAINQCADLPARLMREFGHLSRKLWRHDLMRRDPPRVELLDPAQLIRL